MSTPAIIAPGVLWPVAELVPVFEALRWFAQAPPRHQPRQACPWCALTAYASRCFAQANGWTVRSASFSLPMLQTGRPQRRNAGDYCLPDPVRFDHPQFFVATDRGDRSRLRPVALVVHNTDPRAIPAAPGLRVDPLPDSWVWPRVLRAWVVRPQLEEDS